MGIRHAARWRTQSALSLFGQFCRPVSDRRARQPLPAPRRGPPVRTLRRIGWRVGKRFLNLMDWALWINPIVFFGLCLTAGATIGAVAMTIVHFTR